MKTKKIFTFIISLIMTIIFAISVQAKTAVDANWSSAKGSVKVGENVVITLSFENYTDVTKGFNAFKATLEYDENVFEEVTERNFISLNDWEELKYNPVTHEFVAIKKVGSKNAEDIVQVSLKVKQNATSGSSSVRVADLVTSEGEEDIHFTSNQGDSHEVKLNIVKEQETNSPGNENVNNNDNNNSNNNNIHNSNNSNDKGSSTKVDGVNNNKVDENKNEKPNNAGGTTDDNKADDNDKDKTNKENSEKDSSKTEKSNKSSITTIAMIIVPLLIGIIVFIIIFRKNKNRIKNFDDMNKRDKTLMFLLCLIVLLTQFTGTVFVAAMSKGDINQDGTIDYEDIELLEYHLIHVLDKELVDDSFSSADMNNDGELTVTDLTLAVQRVEKTIDYNVVVSDIKAENYYPKKNDEVTIKFSASAKYNARITTAIINEEEYKVEKVGQATSEYQVKVPVGDVAGLKTFNITSVSLYCGHPHEMDELVVVDVQKDKPSIENYLIDEDTTEGTAELSFDIVDRDAALTDGTVQIINENDGTKILNEIVKEGKNKFEFKPQEDIKYSVKFSLNYDLATNELEQKKDCKGNETLSYDYEFAFDYDFKISNIKTYKNQNETVSFEKNESITLGFNSSNNSESVPSKVIINDKEYDVILNGDKYEVQLAGFQDSGIKELKITSVTLSNNKKFDISESSKVEILKDVVSISNYSKEYSVEASNITLNFNIVDKDESFVSGKAILINNVDNTTEEQNITVGENSVVFAIKEDGAYSLRIDVTCARDTEKKNIVNETIKKDDIKLVHDYEFSATNLKTYNIEEATLYFNKNEDVKIRFSSTNNTSLAPAKAIINGKDVTVSKFDNQYQAILDGYATSGVKDIRLEKVILENGKQFLVDLSTKIEVLKSIPRVEAFSYDDNKETNQIVATFTVHDDDNVIKSGTITVLDNKERPVYTSNSLVTGKNTISFNKTTSQLYDVVIKANYDLDTNELGNGKNEYVDHILLYEEIESVHDYKIEMKDIKDITLYKQSGTDVTAVSRINISDLNNLSNYLVKVDMEKLPSFYAPIKSYNTDNGVLNFTLDYQKIIQYDKKGEKLHHLEVEYGEIENGVAERDTVDNFINKVKNNPSGTYKLNHDMDFASITSGSAVLDVDFTGKIDGNGYTISNLSRPLFKSLNGATIENLVIEDSAVKAYGLIAPTMSNTKVKNVHLKDVTVTALGANGTGSFAGIINLGTVIENSSATNVTVGSAKRIGGLVGIINNSTVRNCYISGRVSSGSDAAGGLVGEAPNNSVIENCFVNVKTNFSLLGGSIGGVLGNPGNTLFKNNLSVATSIAGDGHGSRMFGKYRQDISGNSANNYELETSNLNGNSTHRAVNVVSEDTLKTKEFYIDILGWNEDIWDFTNVRNGTYPTLKGADPNYVKNRVDKPNSDKVYIPDYQRISSLSAFEHEKEILYNNLYELMPFYDAKYLVLQGAKIPETDVLNTKLIKTILPYDANGKMMVTLTPSTQNNLKKIKVIFEDNTTKEYTITHEITENNIATYNIDELGVYYNYNRFLTKEDASIINDLITYINSLDYTLDLDTLTSEADSRLYRDYYNEQTKAHIREFVLEFLHSNINNNVTIENSILNNKIKNDYINSGTLKQIVYAYNYYKRWYTIDIGGTDVASLIMFHGDMFSDKMTLESLAIDALASANRATNRTDSFYATSLAKYTGNNNVTSFLDNMIVTLGGYSDVNDWFTENWQGEILEVPLRDHPEVNYRAWQHLKAWPANILPFLTVPENAGFIISGPTSFLIGGQRIYISNPDDPAQHEVLVQKMKNFGALVGEYYNTVAGLINADILNRYHDIHYDTTKWKKADGSLVFIEDSSYQADEPYLKNFNEAVGQWPTVLKGVAAYAYTSRVYFRAYDALHAFGTWSHESGHTQDDKIFFKGANLRGGTGGEDYADGNIAQSHGDGSVNFNLAFNYTMDNAITTNLTTERINSPEKIHDYYRKMYEAIYILDYAEAQAFLRLTPEEQAKVSVKVTYPNATNGEVTASTYNTTAYSVGSVDDFKRMNLKTMSDLWDNQITIRPGVTGTSRVGTNSYGGESLYERHWYQPHNDYGRPDSYSLKYLAWEMMGYAGYDNGYIKYYSNKSANDLDAIRAITGNRNTTWKEYKLQRFQKTATAISNNAYIDSEELINEYEKALKEDAKNNDRRVTTSTNLRRTYYHYLKRVTNDFRDELLKSKTELEASKKITHISTAQELQQKMTEKPYGYYVLDNDIDVSNLTGTNAVIDKTFFGKLDGNGHTITGNKLPLFSKINYSAISNLTLKSFDVNYVGGYIGLANNITGTNRINNVSFSERKIEISSLEDFLKIGVDSEYPLGKSYNITADIDFSQIQSTDIKTCLADNRNGSCIISGIFTGKIYGNGHTFSNLTGATLFNDFRGSVSDLNMTNVTNRLGGQNYVSAFARVTNRATLSNMKFKDITLSGANGVATVVGMDGRTGNSSFNRISVENANVSGTGVYISAFIGRKFGGSVTDVFVQGTVSFGAAANGGVFGAIENNEIISNVVSNVTINRTKNTSGYDTNGGMFGQIVGSPKLVENSISLGSISHTDGSEASIGKFLSKTDTISKLSNCFEYKNASGVSYVTNETIGKLNEATEEDTKRVEFYRDTLKLNSNIWDFSSVGTNGYPKLK